MKKLITLFAWLLLFIIGKAGFAQLSGINYQAVAIDENGKGIPGMDISGQAFASKAIGVKFSILNGTLNTILYQETHSVNTDPYGLFSLVIGEGTLTGLGLYSVITQVPWSQANQFLKVEIDIKKDGNYKLTSIQKFMAVPYAFYASKADTALYSVNGGTPAASAGSVWLLSGNDTTTAGTNFIGTKDSIDFVAKTNNVERFRVMANGNVGIGTSAPGANLSVAGTFGVSEAGNTGNRLQISSTGGGAVIFQNDNSPIIFKTLAGNQEKMRIEDNGNVGIGTAVPLGKLHVNNDFAGSDSSFVVLQNGNVGIGTITPGANLEVAGQVKITGGAPGAGKVLTSDAAGLASWQSSTAAGVDTITVLAPLVSTGGSTPQISVPANSLTRDGFVTAGGANFDKVWKTDASGNPAWRSDSAAAYNAGTGLSLTGSTINSVWTAAGADIYNNNVGNVGIGTAGPSSMLGVEGAGGTDLGKVSEAAATFGGSKGVGSYSSILLDYVVTHTYAPVAIGYVVTDNTAKRKGDLVFAVRSTTADIAPTEQMRITSAGDVGIGTTAPGELLEVGSLTSTNDRFIRIANSGATTYNSGIKFRHNTVGYGITIQSQDAIPQGLNILYHNNNNAGVSAMFIDRVTGKVGIGTTTPAEKLEVTGNARISSLAGTGTRMVQADVNGTLITLAAGTANQVLLGTGIWGSVPTDSTWSLSGNAGTLDATNFIGTVDNVPFNIRVNNKKAGRIDHVLFNTFLGYHAGDGTTSGNYNTASGSYALEANTTGTFNTATGDFALTDNTTGNFNTATGVFSLLSNTTGGDNTATGMYALNSNTTGFFNTANGFKALYSNTSANYNTATGGFAMYSNTTGDFNTAHGYYSLYANTTGIQNTAFGINSLKDNSTGNNNTAMGVQALEKNTTGEQNAAYGSSTLSFNTIGGYNTGLGTGALYSNTQGNSNTAVGAYSLSVNDTGHYNTAVGFYSLYNNTFGSFNTATGVEALLSNTTGAYNTSNGAQSLRTNTTGSRNTADGFQALLSNTTGVSNTAIGMIALEFNTTGTQNTAIGDGALGSNTVGNFNVAMGVSALVGNVNGNNNTALGTNALQSNTSGTSNTATGYQALISNSGGNDNTATGGSTLASNLTGIGNTANGRFALFSNTTGNYNTANGRSALQNTTTGSNNTATGRRALFSSTVGTQNTANGFEALYSNVAGSNATAIGTNAMYYSNSSATPFTNYNVAVGFEALRGSVVASANIGNYNTALGYQTLFSNVSGIENTATGYNALYSNTTGFNNTADGHKALYSNTLGANNTAVGDSALYNNTVGIYNTAVGSSSLFYNTTGIYNSASGAGALHFNTTGNYNTATGVGALGFNNTGFENTATGAGALYFNIIGNKNVATGNNSLKNNFSGSYNVAIGEDALYTNTVGSYNTAVGYQTFETGAAFTNSTAIGYKAVITADNTVQLGNASITNVKTSGTMNANGYVTAFSNQGSNYTLTATDDIVSVTGTTNIALPTAIGITGRKYTVKNTGAGTVTVSTTGGQTIDGVATKSLALQYDFVTVVSDGANWFIVAK